MKDLVERHREAAAAGRIELQRCRRCGALQAMARPFCASCGSTDLAVDASTGRGRVAAVTTLHRAPTPAYRERVPYAIALVDLEEGVRIMGHAAPEIAVGDAVAARLRPLGERSLIVFEPAPKAPRSIPHGDAVSGAGCPHRALRSGLWPVTSRRAGPYASLDHRWPSGST